jgi:tRNA(Ile)-lysidine synthase
VSRVVAEVRRILAAHAVAGPGVVAVSGGADSVALLRALLEAGCAPLWVAHFNHKLRGRESDEDAAFVLDLADNFGLRYYAVERDLRAEIASTGENLEAAARRLRYEWLCDIARREGAAWIATGHTADDQAETVLHRLIRGTGVQGLRGIAVVRDFPGPRPTRPQSLGSSKSLLGSPRCAAGTATVQGGPKILRPLLTVTRAELLDYFAELGQSFRTDSSNADPRFTRNRIRHELLPLLTTFNPEVVAVLGRLAEQADELYWHLESEAAALLATAELPRAGDLLVFDEGKLTAAPPHRVRDALRLVWEREGWPRDAMTYAHWHRLAALTPGDYPGGIHVRQVGHVVQIGRHS